MKIKLLFAIPLCTLLLNCSSDESILPSKTEDKTVLSNQPEHIKASNAYPDNQMVIRYRANLPEVKKEILRQKYNVQSFQECNCSEEDLELWFVNYGPGPGGTDSTIEEKVVGAKDDSGVEGSDFNTYLNQSSTNGGDLSNGAFETAFDKIVTRNKGITIAVIDTGVDYNYYNFPDEFLYNSKRSSVNCTTESSIDYFGWDFVNNDNNPLDDHGHGTVVTHLITSELEKQKIDYQILPLKAFDKNGKGTYFNILCAYLYAYKNPDVKLVNLSFGWDESNFEILTHYILMSKNKMLAVSSAGNSAHDTDQILHYPSNVNSENMLSIASVSKNLETSNLELSGFSNYGTQTVDIAAFGENVAFYWTPSLNIPVSGTSFSCPKITALAGTLYFDGINIVQWKHEVISATTPAASLYQIKYSSYLQE